GPLARRPVHHTVGGAPCCPGSSSTIRTRNVERIVDELPAGVCAVLRDVRGPRVRRLCASGVASGARHARPSDAPLHSPDLVRQRSISGERMPSARRVELRGALPRGLDPRSGTAPAGSTYAAAPPRAPPGQRCGPPSRGVTQNAARAVAPGAGAGLSWTHRRPPVVALDLEGDRRCPPGTACAGDDATIARSCPSGPGRRPLRGSGSRANEASTLACRGLFPSRDAFTRWRETSGRRAMANPEKVDAVAEIVELFRDSDAAVITEYRGLSVGELKEL